MFDVPPGVLLLPLPLQHHIFIVENEKRAPADRLERLEPLSEEKAGEKLVPPDVLRVRVTEDTFVWSVSYSKVVFLLAGVLDVVLGEILVREEDAEMQVGDIGQGL